MDENGRLVSREDYRIATLNCGGEDFAVYYSFVGKVDLPDE